MQQVDEKPIETIHLYVVREEEKKPSTLLPLFFASLCVLVMVAVTLYSADNPYFEHKTIRVPAIFLPPQHFTTKQTIIPTGIKTYPATTAHGILTLTNGSVIESMLPKGILFTGRDGVEIVTDTSVFIPAGSAARYGYATVSAHALISGSTGNISILDINSVEGSSIYIRNVAAFTGGKNSYFVKVETPHDRQTALDAARAILASQVANIRAYLAIPCKESSQEEQGILGLSWTCQFVTYTIPSYMSVTHVRLVGKTLLVDVVFVPRPRTIIFK